MNEGASAGHKPEWLMRLLQSEINLMHLSIEPNKANEGYIAHMLMYDVYLSGSNGLSHSI